MTFGITGGIACGKSAVTSILRKNGATIIDADEISRSLVEPGQPLLKKIVHRFGADILREDGSLNRRKLGALVWNDPKQREALGKIMHPFIRKATADAFDKAKLTSHWVGYDAALLIEGGEWKKYKPVVVVAASPETQLKRLMERNKLTAEEAKLRIDSQMPTMEKIKYADIIVWNDGTLRELEEQVGGILEYV